MAKYYLGVDQGTTGVTAILFDTNWRQVGRGYREIRQIYPQAGWVEHDPLDIWNSVCLAVTQALANAAASPDDILCVGVDHEGESIMLWDKETGLPVYNAIVWQDRRTSEKSDALNATHGDFIREHTGLTADSYFSALKLQWLLQNVPEARLLLAQNRLLCGTMDTWLVWKMTGGATHATDTSTGSRTMLMNLRNGCWDEAVLSLLDIPRTVLPTILPSNGDFGRCVPALFCGISAPITGVLVDQQAALFGQTCFTPGTVKTTYGTGCFMQMNTGNKIVESTSGLLPMVCWNTGDKTTYGLDGGIYISGAAIQWLRDGLKIISSAAETEAMAYAAGTNNGVYFVPAFAGLAAPYWDSYARGTLIGITGGTTREQIVRATLEATAYQVSDLLKAMETDSGMSISAMRCDGGAVANGFLMQFQADILGIPLLIPEITETTALGAAFMAAIGGGFVNSPDELQNHWRLARTYEPKMGNNERAHLLSQWHHAVERTRGWAKEI
ncbi:MAG: glycerol kinase GlpK [Oscillospiraceae bacterium]|nr:glycerol kinase GlpK [Oscillospiraceae bacterium]